MSFEAIERAARADRDAQPLTEADLKRMKRAPQAKIIRRALELTQEEFAARYHIPLGTLRDWEQGRAEPDQPTRAYLTLIARDPDHVNRILNRKPSLTPPPREHPFAVGVTPMGSHKLPCNSTAGDGAARALSGIDADTPAAAHFLRWPW
jgi:putative transcriptional regulator